MKTLSHQTSKTGRQLRGAIFGIIAGLFAGRDALASFAEGVNSAFGSLNGVVAQLLFFDVLPGPYSFPLSVAWLVAGAVFFTFRMGFINFRAFKHAIDVTRGHYDDPKDKGEVSHFQALTTALSATVGLGNIAGVAVAVSLGGPGATFWMMVAGLLGMTSKLVECTLGQMYREVRPDGHVMGGPMEYLSRGFAEKGKGWGKVGRGLAVLFAVLCIGGSFGGGNAFQVNQSLNAVKESIPIFGEMPWLYGVLMAIATGVVIIGGIKRIASTADKIVPFMCGIYVLFALFIVLSHVTEIPSMILLILQGAFAPDAMYGGAIGVIITGFKRAAFSNEAGIGSASIAHSAAKTKYPVREGIVALLEPFIDTVVICTMTALVIIITGVHANPEYAELVKTGQGAALTSKAFGEKISWFPYVLSLAVALFAYSTMISWSYYGERCWTYLVGEKYSMVYRWAFIGFAFLGSITTATNVLEFSDLMILAMCLPNIFGMYVLGGKVKTALDDYWGKLQSGAMVKERH
ncbi:MAG: alanine:cation symporter family protein [Bdellovibrionales bacterium]|nr:alanine:cation symporter family protein [Bdellovibrionales bacterium]